MNEETLLLGAKIKVVGVGGAGNAAVNTMFQAGLTGVEFVALDTDEERLRECAAAKRCQIGVARAKGAGTSANPAVGRESAIEDRDRIADLVVGADMVFVTAGLGGGTGTGAAPIVAQLAREAGALTMGVVTRPFWFEGKKRRRQAEEGIEALKGVVDTLITIPNQRLISVVNDRTTMKETFGMADTVLLQAVKGVSDLINGEGVINTDFADVRRLFSQKGVALMGVGIASGEHKTVAAAQRAINSPLLDEVPISGAASVLLNITGNSKLTMYEINEAATLVQEACRGDASLIFGWVVDDTMQDEARVTAIATGFEETRPPRPRLPPWQDGEGAKAFLGVSKSRRRAA